MQWERLSKLRREVTRDGIPKVLKLGRAYPQQMPSRRRDNLLRRRANQDPYLRRLSSSLHLVRHAGSVPHQIRIVLDLGDCAILSRANLGQDDLI